MKAVKRKLIIEVLNELDRAFKLEDDDYHNSLMGDLRELIFSKYIEEELPSGAIKRIWLE